MSAVFAARLSTSSKTYAVRDVSGTLMSDQGPRNTTGLATAGKVDQNLFQRKDAEGDPFLCAQRLCVTPALDTAPGRARESPPASAGRFRDASGPSPDRDRSARRGRSWRARR